MNAQLIATAICILGIAAAAGWLTISCLIDLARAHKRAAIFGRVSARRANRRAALYAIAQNYRHAAFAAPMGEARNAMFALSDEARAAANAFDRATLRLAARAQRML